MIYMEKQKEKVNAILQTPIPRASHMKPYLFKIFLVSLLLISPGMAEIRKGDTLEAHVWYELSYTPFAQTIYILKTNTGWIMHSCTWKSVGMLFIADPLHTQEWDVK